MTPCFFSFEDGTQFPGYDHGTTWNGWANVSVDKYVLKSIMEWNGGQVLNNLPDTQDYGLFEDLTADENGLYHLNGYMVTIEVHHARD